MLHAWATPFLFFPLAGRRACAWLMAVVAILFAVATGWGQGEFPSIPQDGKFVQDFAGIVSAETDEQLGVMQRNAFREHDTAIIVVTINSQAAYGGGGESIEDFARAWFDHWEIGKRTEDGGVFNQGILVLVSVGDRSARIELGADWGRSWDRHCARIMDKRMVPEFADGDYGAGLLAGIQALEEMAALGPEAEPPGGLGPLIERLEERPFSTSPLPLWGTGLMILGGLGLIGWFVVGKPTELFVTEKGGWILIAGIAMIAAAFVFWVALAIAAIFLKGTGGADGSGGFSSGSGFGGGGFSGGGGASGSW